MENKTENSLLQQVRLRTRPLHTQLEATYPFSTLQGEAVTESDLRVFFSIMWSVFAPLFDATPSPLLQSKKAVLELMKTPETSVLPKDYHPLALGYVFIGSLLGGGQVIQKNPKIQASEAKEYFATEQKLLAMEWSSLLSKLKTVTGKEESQIVDDCVSIFEVLIACGYSKEKAPARHLTH